MDGCYVHLSIDAYNPWAPTQTHVHTHTHMYTTCSNKENKCRKPSSTGFMFSLSVHIINMIPKLSLLYYMENTDEQHFNINARICCEFRKLGKVKVS